MMTAGRNPRLERETRDQSETQQQRQQPGSAAEPTARQEEPPTQTVGRRRDTGRVDVIDRTVQKTHEWINQVAAELGNDATQQQAYAALRTVLHAIRDRLTVDEAAHLAAQLPLLIRGVYYEGWKPAAVPVRARNREELLDLIREGARGWPVHDAEQMARAVFKLLSRAVTAGEIKDVKGMLPQDALDLWPDT